MFRFLNEGLFPSSLVIGNNKELSILLLVFAVIVVSYLLGSLNSAIIVSRILYRDDVRRHGSGNAGLTNMHRTYGKWGAILTLIGDMLKTAVAIIFSACIFGFWYMGGVSTHFAGYIAGLFAVLGHVFPVYYKFKGGKGVLVTSTMALILSPIPLLILFAAFALIVWATKYISLGSVTGAILYPVVLHSYFRFVLSNTPNGLITLSAIILAIFIVWCHRENLSRISNRTENKFSFKKKPEIQKKSEEANKDDDQA